MGFQVAADTSMIQNKVRNQPLEQDIGHLGMQVVQK